MTLVRLRHKYIKTIGSGKPFSDRQCESGQTRGYRLCIACLTITAQFFVRIDPFIGSGVLVRARS